MTETLHAIALSLKKGFHFPDTTETVIETSIGSYQTSSISLKNCVSSDISIFNKEQGKITLSQRISESSFLKEEQPL